MIFALTQKVLDLSGHLLAGILLMLAAAADARAADADLVETWVNQANRLRLLDNPDAARAILQRAAALDPTRRSVLAEFAALETDEGHDSKSTNSAKRAELIAGKPETSVPELSQHSALFSQGGPELDHVQFELK